MARARTHRKAEQAGRLLSAWSRMGIAFDRAEPAVEASAAVAAGIAYFAGPEVLLIQRGHDTNAYPGHWSFPAGHIEPGEEPAVAAMRESYEEIAHFPEDLVPVLTENGFALFVCETEAFEPILNDESLAWQWCRPSALPSPLHPGVAEQILAANPRNFGMDADFDESKHPRAANGQFGEGGGEAHASLTGKEVGEHSDTKELRKAAMKYAEEHIAGKSFKNSNSGHDIKVTRQGLKHSLNGANPPEIKLIAALPQMLEKASYSGSVPDRLARAHIKAAHKYTAKVSMGGEDFEVGIVTHEKRDGHEHYDHFIVSSAKAKPPTGVPGAQPVSGEEKNQPAKGAEQSIPPSKDSAVAEDKRDIDLNGYMTVENNPISKVGIFEYRGNQIPDAPDPQAMYRVYRPAEELSSAEAIESFKLSPWIDNHTMLGAEDEGLTPAEKKGVQGVIGENVYFKDGVLYGNLRVFSQAMKTRIEQGKRELSCGYRCRYDATPGTWNGQPYDYVQREIRGNHLALVDEGRMGPEVAVQDQADRFVFTCDSNFQSTEDQDMDQPSNNAPQGGGSSGVTLESLVAQLNELVKAVAAFKAAQGGGDPGAGDPAANADDPDANAEGANDGDPMANLTKTVDALCQRMDALEGKKVATDNADPGPGDGTPKKQDDDPSGTNEGKGPVLSNPGAMDAKEVDAKVAAGVRSAQEQIVKKTSLAAKVSQFTGAFDHAEMLTEQEVATYACKKLELKPAKGAELATLNGYLHGRTPPAQQKTTAMDSAAGGADWLAKQMSPV
jgi:8-oxo-dGTP pyrophosphatase MutT (NUDIX family)